MTQQLRTIEVVVDERSGADRSIKKFKRLCDAFGVVKEYRRRQEYKKPSIRLKEKTEAALKRRLKAESKSYRRSKI